MTTRLSRPPEPLPTASRETTEARIATLRAELAADSDRRRKAELHVELGALQESELASDAAAVREYLTAFNTDPSFRTPLFALVRIFERRRAVQNLAKLHQAEAKQAANERERASAIVDQAVLKADATNEPEEARLLLEEAHATAPELLDAAVMLEHAARVARDTSRIEQAIEGRARASRDPRMQSLLLVEAAESHAQRGDVDGAYELLDEAARSVEGRHRAYIAMERIARSRGDASRETKALRGLAEAALAFADGRADGHAEGDLGSPAYGNADDARRAATGYLVESALVSLARVGDAGAALADLDRLESVAGQGPLTSIAKRIAALRADDSQALQSADDALRALESVGPFRAALEARAAENAHAAGDVGEEDRALEAARRAAPASAWVEHATRERIARGDDVAALVEHLATRGSDSSRAGRHLASFEAALLASDVLSDFGAAESLFEAAIDAASEARPILRELRAAALRHSEWTAASGATARLVPNTDDPKERSALLFDLVLLAARGGDANRAGLTVKRALGVPEAKEWAPALARLVAATTGDSETLERAHALLAEAADEGELAAAHHAAAARAAFFAGRKQAAEEQLRRALDRQPGHPYALALLEEILRAKGEGDEVVSLLRDAALAAGGARAAEMKLLLAGAAAEATNDSRHAIEAYEQAAANDPESTAPFWSLRRLAQSTGDAALLLRAREGLAERERDADDGARSALELAEHYDLRAAKPDLAVSELTRALDDETIGRAAALDLLLLDAPSVDARARLAAAERLRETASGADRNTLTRTVAAFASLASDDAKRDEALAVLADADDAHATTALLSLAAAERADAPRKARAAALRRLARAITTPETSADVGLHASRVALASGAEGAAEDALLEAQFLASQAPDSVLAAVALDEATGPADEAELYADAVTARAKHSSPAHRATLESARARALAAVRGDASLAPLLRVVASNPKDFAAWDALRGAARESGRFDEVVRACDALAVALDGELRASLLEEAGLVLVDHLDRDDEGEAKLREALELDPLRDVAYRRLHARLTTRSDTRALVTLVEARARHVDDEKLLEKLHYELARLHRGHGEKQRALASLEEVLLLTPDHAGALAMSVEMYVATEAWNKAVDSLRKLASSDVPSSQKRVARLGAADFLEKKLGDPRGALAELTELDAIGLGDVALYARMAQIAETAGLLDEAARALDRATELASTPSQAADFAHRAGGVRLRLTDEPRAKESFERALTAKPDHEGAAAALTKLLVEPTAFAAHVDRFERAVRAQLHSRSLEPDAIRKLFLSAGWRGQKDLQKLAVGALVALGVATDDEHDIDDENTSIHRRVRPNPAGAEQLLSRIRAPGDDGPVAALVAALEEAFVELEGLEPSKLGAGRGDLVSPKSQDHVRSELADVAAAFGIGVHDHYAIAQDLKHVVTLPARQGVTFVIGKSARAPVELVHRFHAGRQLAAAKAHALPLLDHTPADVALRIFAACAAAESPLRGGDGRPGMPELTKAIGRVLSRRAKRAVQDLAPRIDSPERAIDAYAQAARRTTLRAGLLLAGDLYTSLEAVIGQPVSLDAVRASEDAMDLVAFHLSQTSLALRRELGLAS